VTFDSTTYSRDVVPRDGGSIHLRAIRPDDKVAELDLNPVKVLAPGKGAVVVDGRMRVRTVRATSPG
jgi:hypothetical protein